MIRGLARSAPLPAPPAAEERPPRNQSAPDGVHAVSTPGSRSRPARSCQRGMVMPFGWSGISQPLPSAERGGLGQQRMAEGDVGQGQAPVPEQDGLLVVLAAGPQSRDDLAKLGVQAVRRQLARLDVGAQRAELAGGALA